MRRHHKKRTWMKEPTTTHGTITVLARLPDGREEGEIVRIPAGAKVTDEQLTVAIGQALDRIRSAARWAPLSTWKLRFKLSPNLSHLSLPVRWVGLPSEIGGAFQEWMVPKNARDGSGALRGAPTFRLPESRGRNASTAVLRRR